MNLDYSVLKLSSNAIVVQTLVADVSIEQAHWKPAEDKWSILEVVNHLYDEEREDFRPRLEKTLRDPKEKWDRIEPKVWAIERKYNGRNLEDSLANFLSEREKSLGWLRTLMNPNWENTHISGKLILSAGDLLASWVAHDILHIKQITRLHYDYVAHLSAPFSPLYAGEWK